MHAGASDGKDEGQWLHERDAAGLASAREDDPARPTGATTGVSGRARRDAIQGVRLDEAPPVLRHFSARFGRVTPVGTLSQSVTQS